MPLSKPLIKILPPEGKANDYVINDSPDALDSLYKRLAVKHNFKYNYHALRHYFASVMLKLGIPDKYAKERMGHATDNMLKTVYQHIFADKQAEFSNKLNDFFTDLTTDKSTATDSKKE